MRRATVLLMTVAMAALPPIAGCAQQPEARDYSQYLAHMPRSILVLPPLNESTQVHAPDAFLSTITVPLAERGYYVFPVAVVDQFMKDNGLPTPGEMHQVPAHKFGEVLGADAVLYITIKNWTTTYIVIDSSTVVGLNYRLVDARSGVEMWKDERSFTFSTSAGQSDPLAALVAAAVHAAINPNSANERRLAAAANFQIIHDPNNGMLVATHHPKFNEEQQRVKEKQQSRAELASAKPR